jgi:hypothetical protein
VVGELKQQISFLAASPMLFEKPPKKTPKNNKRKGNQTKTSKEKLKI